MILIHWVGRDDPDLYQGRSRKARSCCKPIAVRLPVQANSNWQTRLFPGECNVQPDPGLPRGRDQYTCRTWEDFHQTVLLSQHRHYWDQAFLRCCHRWYQTNTDQCDSNHNADLDIHVEGSVESKDLENNTVQISGVVYTINTSTLFLDSSTVNLLRFSLANINVGDNLSVTGQLSGSDIVLTRLERVN